MNVLLADDDSSVRALLSAVLRGEGWNVLEARDGEEALALHGRGDVRLLISDWRMPGLDGVELCRRLRAARDPFYTYFILISATHAESTKVEAAMRAGVDDFLFKPLDFVSVRLRLHAARRLLLYANRLRELEAVIPICASCRRLRDDQHAYHRMEAYFERHAAVLFSHGICPDCERRAFAELAREGAS